jgi:predicted DNA-binding transcriptional regulator YafY
MLLLLQNRGRLTSADLARELEVARRTVLRDVDALTEAGLPMVVHQGHKGGIELGFNFRTRLTGLAADEAEAIGVLLSRPVDDLAALGMADAANRARRKLLESFPDVVRARASQAARRFRFVPDPAPSEDDPRLPALASAVREHRVVRIHAYRPQERIIHPIALVCQRGGWLVEDDRVPTVAIPLDACGDINISARRFTPTAVAGATPTPSIDRLCTTAQPAAPHRL